jgi:hypothetical protein
MQAPSSLLLPTFEIPEILTLSLNGKTVYKFNHSFDLITLMDFMINTAEILGNESKPLEESLC